MVERFIADFARLIAAQPELIEVDRHDVNEEFCEITVYAGGQDVGKIIGKDGNMINAIKTVVSGCKAKDHISYRILVKPLHERQG